MDKDFFRGLDITPEGYRAPKKLTNATLQWLLAMRARAYVRDFN